MGTVQETSAGAIIYRTGREGREYLLLRNKKGHWDFPKGHIEEGEDAKAAALREIHEETGLRPKDLAFIPGFAGHIDYSFTSYAVQGGGVHKAVTYFLASTTQGNITISPEHSAYGWHSFEEARAMVKFKNTRALLKDAEECLSLE